MSQKKHLSYKIKVRQAACLFIAFLSLVSVFSFNNSQQASANSDCSDVFTPLSSFVVNGVNANKSFYVSAMNQTGVPWEFLAAIHYRETNFSHTNPSNGQGIFQFVNGDGGPYPPGPVSDAEFVRQLTFMANKIQSDYALRNAPSPASVSPRRLTANEQDITLVKNTLFSYNGRATQYANQATQYGYNSSTQPYEGSPYVMNRYDCPRARMGIITRDYGTGIDGVDTRYGAFTIFSRLRGDAYWLSTFAPYSWSSISQETYSDPQRTRLFTSTTTSTPNSKIYVRIKARNIGSQTWSQSNMRVGASNPNDRQSQFRNSDWVNPNRPASMSEQIANPGQIATFDFSLTLPATPGSYREYFNLVADGITWLNNPGLYFPIYVVNRIDPPNSRGVSLLNNTILKPGNSLLSPDTHSRLSLQTDGNLVFYSNFRPIWSTGTSGTSPKHLIMQPDGNLVLYSTTNQPLWYSGSGSVTGDARLNLQTDGNLVINDTNNTRAIWSIGNGHNPDHLAFVNQTLPQTLTLTANQTLETPDRRYKLILQEDGNLVIYSAGKAVWSTLTFGANNKGDFLIMQPDGNLVLYDANGKAVWNAGTGGASNTNLILQEDGNLVLYDANGIVHWFSGTFGR